MFQNRQAAGKQLAALIEHRCFTQPIVLGIPRGGVVLSVEVARALDAGHGVIVARKLGAKYQPELAIGAITADGAAYINESIAEMTGADDEYLTMIRNLEQTEAKRREAQFDGDRRPTARGRTAVIVDDGVATGATAIAAIRAMKAEGADHVVFAVPVGPPHTISELKHEADEVICLHEEPSFFSVGQFYREFGPVSDAEVKTILDVYDRKRERV